MTVNARVRLRPHPGVGVSVATGLIGKVEVSSFTAPEELFPMTDDRLPPAELMAKTGDGDFLRSVAESVLQIIMEADIDDLIGAGRHERSGERSTWRNGYGVEPISKFCRSPQRPITRTSRE